MTEIVMPRLSDSMEEGTILRWLKREGERVARGEELVEIETDKASMTYESDQAGTLTLLAAEGDTLPVGAPIARVEDEDERPAPEGPADEGVQAPLPPEPPPPPRVPSTPAPSPEPGERTIVSPSMLAEPGERTIVSSSTPAPSPEPGERTIVSSSTSAPSGERIRASPLARRLARERGVELGALHGSGPGGRIVKADVLAGAPHVSLAQPSAGAGPSEPQPPAAGTSGSRRDPATDAIEPQPAGEGVALAKGETTAVQLNRTQQTIARRMAESKATIPDFQLQGVVDMQACVALREELKLLARGEEVAPTYNDMVVKACALALREHPLANGSYRDGQLQLHSRVNVGVAVAARDALVVPTVFDADAKALGEIARETRALAERVRAGTVTPPELGGGTFTVSNLGMYGVERFAAIVNPPQAAIMSVGSVAQRAVVHEGELAARHTMTLTLVCDHRILYGAEAAQFLARVRELLQAPAALTL